MKWSEINYEWNVWLLGGVGCWLELEPTPHPTKEKKSLIFFSFALGPAKKLLL